MRSKVYFTREITPENVLRLYRLLGIDLEGKVAVKLHSGETGNQNFLRPEFFKPIIDSVGGTVVEGNTAYDGTRNTTEAHYKTMEAHGWSKLFKVDIMDETDEMVLPIAGGKRITENYVGEHFKNYDSMLVLSHFKGHPMGGFGGALKTISIGIASSHGKAHIHGAGDPEKIWTADHDAFLESMADAAKSIMDALPGRIAFINVMKNMSVDCDCVSHPAASKLKDYGILASTDPVALDQACVDIIFNMTPSDGNDNAPLKERITSRHGIHTIEHAEEIGLGSRKYELVNIDKK